MDIKTSVYLWFADLVFVAFATKELAYNVRFHLKTEKVMYRNSFVDSSGVYNETKSVVESMDFKCTDLIKDIGGHTCLMNISLVRIEPIKIEKGARVVMRANLEFAEDINLPQDQFDLPTLSYNFGQVLKRRYGGLILSNKSVITFPQPITCKDEYDDLIEQTWTQNEAGAFRSMMYPPEKLHSNVIRFALRECSGKGWTPVTLITREGFSVNCDTTSIIFLCHQFFIRNLPDDYDSDQLHKILLNILSGFQNDGDSNLTLVVSDILLWFIDEVVDTARTLANNVLDHFRRSIHTIVINFPLHRERHFHFKSSQIAMQIHDVKEITSAGRSVLYFEIRTLEGSEIMAISSNIDRSIKRHHVAIPVKSILDSVADVKDVTVDRISLYVFKNDFLFRPTDAVFSKIYSVLIPGMESTVLKENITLTFDIIGRSEHRCVFWDPSLNVGDGGWSDYGCSTLQKNNDRVECHCNHLSSFAVMAIPAMSKSETSRLHWFSLIGCTVSTVSLILTLITYLSSKSLRSDIPSKILLIICGHLLCTNLLYILNVLLVFTDIENLNLSHEASFTCKCVAALFHYFLLASLAWMSANGYIIYKTLAGHLRPSHTTIWRVPVLASGLPLLIVLPTVMMHFNTGYGLVKGEICWLKDTLSILLFIIPVALITAYNKFIFLMAFIQMKRIIKTDGRSSIEPIITQFKGGVSIIVLLGLTWLFAFMAVSWDNIILGYLFVLCNSFQGLFFFLFYCVFKEQARNLWIMCLEGKQQDRVISSSSKTQEMTSSPVGENSISPLDENFQLLKLSTIEPIPVPKDSVSIRKSTSIY